MHLPCTDHGIAPRATKAPSGKMNGILEQEQLIRLAKL
jgi:hypothetical protein